MAKVIGALLLIIGAMGCASGDYHMTNNPNVGYAEISNDGVLTLYLVGVGGGGEIAHGIKTYKPGDPYYDKVKDHIGPIQPGEKKTVPPWPDL
jgi:hypothetical protein